MRIAIVGCGSIGSRHSRNLAQIGGHELVLHDPDTGRAVNLANEVGGSVAPNVREALANGTGAVLVCTPPHLHAVIAQQALEAGAHCFVEKPMATDLAHAKRIVQLAESKGLTLMAGFNLRFHAGLQKLQQLVEGGSAGKIVMLRAEFGQYLPDWRPGTDYRTNYITATELGGGIIQEESHELDYIGWLGGPVVDVYAAGGKLSDLEMSAEDSALMVLRLRSGAIAEIHVDCVQRGYSRSCKVIGTEGTVEWVYETGVRLTRGRGDVEKFDIVPDPNLMYVREMAWFLDCCAGKVRPPVDGHSAIMTMRVAAAAKRSLHSRKAEPVV